MKTIIKRSLQSLLLVPALALGVSLVAPSVAHAQLQTGIDATGQNSTSDVSATATVLAVTNWITFIVGAAAVIFLIFGAFRYITSSGDANKVTAAKNTILYAIIGLIVAVLAGVIINFVISGVENGSLQGPS